MVAGSSFNRRSCVSRPDCRPSDIRGSAGPRRSLTGPENNAEVADVQQENPHHRWSSRTHRSSRHRHCGVRRIFRCRSRPSGRAASTRSPVRALRRHVGDLRRLRRTAPGRQLLGLVVPLVRRRDVGCLPPRPAGTRHRCRLPRPQPPGRPSGRPPVGRRDGRSVRPRRGHPRRSLHSTRRSRNAVHRLHRCKRDHRLRAQRTRNRAAVGRPPSIRAALRCCPPTSPTS